MIVHSIGVCGEVVSATVVYSDHVAVELTLDGEKDAELHRLLQAVRDHIVALLPENFPAELRNATL